ncbi:Dpy-30 motif protein (macronuclear) [Tetrahymena thermophila SB210]|uniref:Dpy-30 motif protein n=1 Tax=Tetrahymena thermophila (strain SB210) TaxID=312017 RepID=Q22W95_TETTS|nr:Dpy-30 motif protein [Tetrahymena thermophila SB210]EAR89522.2 Dpy-30 motif protein [Tetrahymena thermophila SB210]|eukprot:XP_001009767.2 Dpy-30 motif protein [Tetrahymena thermophila SB210]
MAEKKKQQQSKGSSQGLQNIADEDDEQNQNQDQDDGLLTGASNQQGGGGSKFQQLPLRDYYESSVTQVLLEGLRELGAKRPENPIQFLGKFLLDRDPEKKK